MLVTYFPIGNFSFFMDEILITANNTSEVSFTTLKGIGWMKKHTLYMLSVLLLAVLLCGCGNNTVTDDDVVTDNVSPAATATIAPTDNTDGVVTDDDGIIDGDDDDNGIATDNLIGNDNDILDDDNKIVGNDNNR